MCLFLNNYFNIFEQKFNFSCFLYLSFKKKYVYNNNISKLNFIKKLN